MTKITPEDLVRYAYNEASQRKTVLIQNALQTDWNLKKSYEKLLSSLESLNGINFSPRPESIKKILEYASKSRSSLAST
ncbi:MAG: hypothetical protein ABI297_09105 [Ginsengibacter sp.]